MCCIALLLYMYAHDHAGTHTSSQLPQWGVECKQTTVYVWTQGVSSMLCALQVQGVAKFVANRNLPPALKEDISRHLEGSQLIRNEQGEEDVFSRLSHTLQVCHEPLQSSRPPVKTSCTLCIPCLRFTSQCC